MRAMNKNDEVLNIKYIYYMKYMNRLAHFCIKYVVMARILIE